MALAPLPALPEAVGRRIIHEALAAEETTVQAVARLSSVCRTWHELLRGKRSAQPPSSCSLVDINLTSTVSTAERPISLMHLRACAAEALSTSVNRDILT